MATLIEDGDVCACMHPHTQDVNQKNEMEPGNEARGVSNW